MPLPRELTLVSNADERVGLRSAAETPPSVLSEAALVRRARSGDVEAFANLYNAHRPALLAICLKRLRDRDSAEDVVQDTFLRAYASLDAFDEQRPLGAWLNAIAVRRCIDMLRRSCRTSSSEDVEDHFPQPSEADPTLAAVVAGEERRRLERALTRLAPRQRRALLLHALEGWSHADIAAAEGVSVSSTKSLLFHAREKLRLSCRRGMLATLLVPAGALRRRWRASTEAIGIRIRSATEPLLGAVSGVLAPSASAVAVALAVLAQTAAPALQARTPDSAALAGSTLAGSPAGGLAVKAAPSRPGSSRSLVDAVLHPTQDATPEDTQINSVAASPNYEEDRTLFAAGRVPCPKTSCMVLFVSRDGGATWHRQQSADFHGHTVLLPPSYPSDTRIFAMGDSGLEVSTDGGSTFDLVVPLQGDVAISPLFNRQDPRILIGASVVTEYWANNDLAKPATLIGPAGTWLTIAFSPTYVDDHTVFVGGIRPDASGKMRPTVSRCAASICENVVFDAGFDAPRLRPSPGYRHDRTVYAFTSDVLFRSIDGGTTFSSASPSFARDGSFRDVLVTRNGELIAAVGHNVPSQSGLYRSKDGGVTWSGTRVRVPGFEAGVSRIIALPDGRLIALGAGSGLACSADGGRTWSARCDA